MSLDFEWVWRIARHLAGLVVTASILGGGTVEAAPEFPRWKVFGPPGGEAAAIRSDPQVRGRVFALDSSGRAFVSADSGATWEVGGRVPCERGAPQLRIAEGREGEVFAVCTKSVWRSRDGARTWERFTPADPATSLLLGDFAVPRRKGVAVATENTSCPKVHVTVDDGRNWQVRTCATTRVPRYVAYDPTRAGRLFGLTSRPSPESPPGTAPYLTILSSEDDGLSWSVASSIPPGPAGFCLDDAIAVDAAGTVVVTSTCGAHSSSDSGRTWTPLPLAEPIPRRVRAHPSVPGRLLMHGVTAVNESLDGGRVWSALPRDGRVGSDADFDLVGDGIWSVYRGVFHWSRGDATWAERDNGRKEPALVASASENASILLALTGSLGFRSVDEGATWVPIDAGGLLFEGGFMAVPTQPGIVFSRVRMSSNSADTYLAKSVDAGASWSRSSSSLEWPAGSSLGGIGVGAGAALYAISVTLQCQNIIIPLIDPCTVVSSRVVRFDESGGSWTHVDAGITGRALQVIPSASSSRVAAAETTTGLFVTDSAGAAWRLAWDRNLRGAWDEAILDRSDSRLLYLRVGRTVWVSEDLGENWRAGAPLDINGESLFLRADPKDRGRAYLANPSGAVFETRDAGRSWSSIVSPDEMLAGTFVLSPTIGARQSERILFGAGSPSAYRLTLSGSEGLALGSGLWGRTDEPGWGLSITQHATGQVFVAWYTFSAEGEPVWKVIPGGEWSDRSTFQGTAYSTRASGFLGIPFATQSVVIEESGSATLRFDGLDKGLFIFESPDGSRIEQPIERLRFGPPEAGTRADRGDLWWDPRESGWGIAIAQQYGKLFGTWFIYDDTGRPTWLALPDGVWSSTTAGPTYTGVVFRARGAPPGVPYDPSAFGVTSVGTAAMTFYPEGDALFTYDISGRSGSRNIRRQPF